MDNCMAKTLSRSFNDAFINTLVNGSFRFIFKKSSIPQARNTQDFVGLNYYSGDLVSFNPFKTRELLHTREIPPEAELSENGFIANVPHGFFKALRWAKGYGKPIIVTENGIEDSSDSLRPQYIVEHIHKLWRAANFNWQIKGYFHWSLVDNFEWDRGWSQRFGLWGLDLETQERIRRPSVDLYEAICKTNGLSTQMVEQYAPQVFDKMFPVS